MAIRFERLISRSVAVALSHELDMAGLNMSVEVIARIAVVGSMAMLAVVPFAVYFIVKLSPLLDFVCGLGAAALFIVALYSYLEYMIDKRRTKMETLFPDYLQIASANLRSGISLDRAMLLAARPEFGFFSDDVKNMNRRVFSGENLGDALRDLASKYRSFQLSHAVRMILESLTYGGAMADLLEQLSKDMRSQQLTQKEISGQLFLYSIFIAFAALIASPVLYGLTSQMIVVTDTVWKGILASNPGGLPSTGFTFLKPTPPKITPQEYQYFSIAAILIITGFASLIMSAISSGSAIKGIRYLPLFILIGIALFFIMQTAIGTLFTGIAGGV
ncbi:MAG: type II secretion system F family protein [Candidatus Micrarchaeota archaeon]|nr:type II secretion system F family protein [Candidatus Micrarchaeota archaeon]